MKRFVVVCLLLFFTSVVQAAIPTVVGFGTITSWTLGDRTPAIHASTVVNDIVLIFVETADSFAKIGRAHV